MKREKEKRRADHGARALKMVNEIRASIANLHDEDLLDFHDIFSETPEGALGIFASQEISHRNITTEEQV